MPAAEASLALAAKVFRTGLLDDDAMAATSAGRRVPLGELHGDAAWRPPRRGAGVEVVLGATVDGRPHEPTAQRSTRRRGHIAADAVIVATPPEVAAALVPAGLLDRPSASARRPS